VSQQFRQSKQPVLPGQTPDPFGPRPSPSPPSKARLNKKPEPHHREPWLSCGSRDRRPRLRTLYPRKFLCKANVSLCDLCLKRCQGALPLGRLARGWAAARGGAAAREGVAGRAWAMGGAGPVCRAGCAVGPACTPLCLSRLMSWLLLCCMPLRRVRI
jgi:hypothetical protein